MLSNHDTEYSAFTRCRSHYGRANTIGDQSEAGQVADKVDHSIDL